MRQLVGMAQPRGVLMLNDASIEIAGPQRAALLAVQTFRTKDAARVVLHSRTLAP